MKPPSPQRKKIIINKQRLKQRVRGRKNPFFALVRSIIFQQLSGNAASSILKKFLALWPKKKFPSPNDVLALSDAQFRSVGISTQKAGYLRDLAEKFSDGTVVPRKLPRMTDGDIIEHLVQVKGVGVWTAHMFLIFSLGRENVLPTGDLAVRKGFQKVFNLRAEPSDQKMKALAQPYEGMHSHLALYLWDVMDNEKEQKKCVVKEKKKSRIVRKKKSK